MGATTTYPPRARRAPATDSIAILLMIRSTRWPLPRRTARATGTAGPSTTWLVTGRTSKSAEAPRPPLPRASVPAST